MSLQGICIFYKFLAETQICLCQNFLGVGWLKYYSFRRGKEERQLPSRDQYYLILICLKVQKGSNGVKSIHLGNSIQRPEGRESLLFYSQETASLSPSY